MPKNILQSFLWNFVCVIVDLVVLYKLKLIGFLLFSTANYRMHTVVIFC